MPCSERSSCNTRSSAMSQTTTSPPAECGKTMAIAAPPKTTRMQPGRRYSSRKDRRRTTLPVEASQMTRAAFAPSVANHSLWGNTCESMIQLVWARNSRNLWPVCVSQTMVTPLRPTVTTRLPPVRKCTCLAVNVRLCNARALWRPQGSKMTVPFPSSSAGKPVAQTTAGRVGTKARTCHMRSKGKALAATRSGESHVDLTAAVWLGCLAGSSSKAGLALSALSAQKMSTDNASLLHCQVGGRWPARDIPGPS
mmetsp:Transcript_91260/g.263332  ORF Transcript_91260/g.263332 Transcript_91260/m.263332 type:complete len:253 (+) Transcript_91260:728-1486(+)